MWMHFLENANSSNNKSVTLNGGSNETWNAKVKKKISFYHFVCTVSTVMTDRTWVQGPWQLANNTHVVFSALFAHHKKQTITWTSCLGCSKGLKVNLTASALETCMHVNKREINPRWSHCSFLTKENSLLISPTNVDKFISFIDDIYLKISSIKEMWISLLQNKTE